MAEEPEAILAGLQFNAKKLAALVYHSTMPQEVKDALLDLAPEMPPRQLDKLLAIMEARYLDEATREIDEEYKKKIAAKIAKFKKEDLEREKKELEMIKKLNEVLDL